VVVICRRYYARCAVIEHLRVLRPAPDIYAFYDGRIPGHRFADEPNWVDEGALALGIASYAIVAGEQAIVYDTHISVEHARRIRSLLEADGVRRFTVVLSHWHLDHVAGTEAFADCEVIACERTAEHLTENRAAIQAGTLEGPPGIDPLVLPTSVFAGQRELAVGDVRLELIETHIHSDDATLIWLPERRLLLCGDTLEDTVTYVDEPEHFDTHLANLDRLRELGAQRILPNHGDPDVIAAGGYDTGFITATERYIRALLRGPTDVSLREFVADSLQEGWITYFEPYEAVHAHNVGLVHAS
jgi:glyoxylase-like metal-dependent hydrolase (beta-lactamase superfamily II)